MLNELFAAIIYLWASIAFPFVCIDVCSGFKLDEQS